MSKFRLYKCVNRLGTRYGWRCEQYFSEVLPIFYTKILQPQPWYLQETDFKILQDCFINALLQHQGVNDLFTTGSCVQMKLINQMKMIYFPKCDEMAYDGT